MKGGMQTSAIDEIYCKCGKTTSGIMKWKNGKEISIHFTKKSTYWHIFENGKIRRTFKQPKEWS